jgi:CheY-like chemotaxis protein
MSSRKSLLKGKDVLAVDDEEDVLELIQEELEEYDVILATARSHDEAAEKIASLTYDLVILDIMGVRGFDLLRIASAKKIPVVMLTSHALSPETLKTSIELGARAYLPKNHLGKLAPFLEDVMALSYHSSWNKLFQKLGGQFGASFGAEWRKSEKEFWEQFEKEVGLQGGLIITE